MALSTRFNRFFIAFYGRIRRVLNESKQVSNAFLSRFEGVVNSLSTSFKRVLNAF